MWIDGRWYSETELQALIAKYKNVETINAETSLIMGGVVAELKKENAKLKFFLRLAIDTLESSECEDFSYCDVCTDYINHDKECKNGYECFFRWKHSEEAERLIGGDDNEVD